MTKRSATIEPIPVTVTRLEMTAPPTHYPPMPLGQNIAMLRAENMPRHYYRYLMDRVGRQWHWVNALRLSDEALDAALSEPQRNITTLYLSGAPAGFFEIVPDEDACDLHFFGLMPHATGRGLGRWFLGAALHAAWSEKPRVVSVETCTLDHPAALSLYQKLGFSPVAQRVETIVPLNAAERSEIVMRA